MDVMRFTAAGTEDLVTQQLFVNYSVKVCIYIRYLSRYIRSFYTHRRLFKIYPRDSGLKRLA